MYFQNYLPGFAGIWSAEAIVFIFFARMLQSLFTRESRVISFSNDDSPKRVRFIGWLATLLLLLHEFVGWKLPLGLVLTKYQREFIEGSGLAAMAVGFALLRWAFMTMGRHMTPPESTPAADEARLVTGGPYRWCRNPTYLAYWLIFVGAQLWATSPLLILSLPLWLTFRRWAITEEEILTDLFPVDYPRYRQEVWRGL